MLANLSVAALIRQYDALMEREPSLEDVRLCWNQAAQYWDEFVSGGLDYHRDRVHGPALIAACAEVQGKRVLDLGCGQGWATRKLAELGAQTVGVDIADKQIEMARRHSSAGPPIEYVALDAARVDVRWGPDSFDIATACMSLQDMPDPGAVLLATRRVLTPAGRLVCSLPHPYTHMWRYREWELDAAGARRYLKVDGYFETGPQYVYWDMPRLQHHWRTIRWCRSLQEWWILLRAAVFLVTGLAEPWPTPRQAAGLPELVDCSRVPYYIVLTATLADSIPDP